MNCCSIKGSHIVTWTVWFRHNAGNNQSSINGWHAIWLSLHARPPRNDKLQHFVQTLQPLLPRRAQGEAAFNIETSSAHRKSINIGVMSKQHFEVRLVKFSTVQSKKKKLPLQHFLHPSVFYDKYNSSLIIHATTQSLNYLLVTADTTCLKSAGVAFLNRFTQCLSVVGELAPFGEL